MRSFQKENRTLKKKDSSKLFFSFAKILAVSFSYFDTRILPYYIKKSFVEMNMKIVIVFFFQREKKKKKRERFLSYFSYR